jgi:DNA/RNA-binding domain of Phe-tRNA-synthetase-like protein
MSFVITKDCIQLGLRAGAIIFWGVRVAPAPLELRAEANREIRAIQQLFPSVAEAGSCMEVTALRALHHQVGVKPRREQSSVERLLTLALKRGELPAINSLVDAYNLVSLRSRCSLGAHDLDTIALPVSLSMLTGGESFTPLGETEPAAVVPGEYGYVDGTGRLLCRLDVRQADFSKVTEATRNVLLILEGTTAQTPDALCWAYDEVIQQVRRWCGGLAQIVASPIEDRGVETAGEAP